MLIISVTKKIILYKMTFFYMPDIHKIETQKLNTQNMSFLY